jgi:hypothetical protein
LFTLLQSAAVVALLVIAQAVQVVLRGVGLLLRHIAL